MRYGIGEEILEPMSMTAIGQVLNMSRDRVRTLEHKALKSIAWRSLRRLASIFNTIELLITRDSSNGCYRQILNNHILYGGSDYTNQGYVHHLVVL